MTNVQQMTDAELSRWIAEKLEPLSVRGDAKEYVLHWGIAKGTKCWQTMRTGMVADVADDTIHWWARDMVNDPAQSMMLLEKLLSMQIHFTFWPQSNGTVNMTLADGINPHWQVCATFRRAICETYALSLGDEPK